MKILLTGATGYIGRRLQQRLLQEKGVTLRLFVREPEAAGMFHAQQVEVVQGDTFRRDTLEKALKGIDVAYYLIHSMGSKQGDYEDLDRKSAENFRDECITAGVKRIVYLGGLGIKENSSRHLKSRIETGEILSMFPDTIQTIWFRAGIIIGSGGASFEIIRNLVQKLPLMVTPKWVRTMTEPIAVGDVLEYLVKGKDLKCRGNLVVDIGAGKMTFREMLLQAGSAFGLRRFIVPVPFFSPGLSSYWLILMTPVPFGIASALVEGLKYETVKQNDDAEKYFPGIRPRSYKQAIHIAMEEVERNDVLSRWCDSSNGVCYSEDRQVQSGAVFRDVRKVPLKKTTREDVFHRLMSIGGKRGWFRYGVLWKLRGLADKLVGGAGLNRGRRVEDTLRIGDSVDFWKVVDIEENRRLLLLAEMKLPGKAWLEFVIDNSSLVQTAYFIPRGLGGRLYWYLLLPFHIPVFRNMAHQLVRSAGKK
ncbi:MAG TPA: SDR family oxidoreductase [Spirochaetota bacterium]|nr:SDR family oxidoreductase [Spirochaetota bacterium]